MRKTTWLISGALGYVLGTRAGRERYEQIKTQATQLWNHPTVQKTASQATDSVSKVTGKAKDKASDKLGSSDSSSSYSGAGSYSGSGLGDSTLSDSTLSTSTTGGSTGTGSFSGTSLNDDLSGPSTDAFGGANSSDRDTI